MNLWILLTRTTGARLTYPKMAYFNAIPHHVALSLAIQASLAFGLAGLFWPEKFLSVFDVLMFPWPSSYRTVRGNSIAAIALSVLLFLLLSSKH
jgi:hypothetical protein